MVYIVEVILLFLICIGTKFRIRPNIIPVIIAVILAIVMGGATEIPDYETYLLAYAHGGTTAGTEFIFDFFVKICKACGMSYAEFRIATAILGLFVLYISIYRVEKILSINGTMLWALYMLYPFALDVVQIRNFLAMAFILCAFTFLAENTTKSKIIYVILVLIATGFQTVGIVFFPLIYLDTIIHKKFFRNLLIIMVLIAIYVGLNRSIVIKALQEVENGFLSGDNRISSYMFSQTGWGWLVFWGQQLVNCIFTYVFASVYNKSNSQNDSSISTNMKERLCMDSDLFVKRIYWANIYLTLFVGLYVINGNYARIMRNITVINDIAFLLYLREGKHLKNKIFVATVYIMYIVTQILIYIWIPHYMDIIVPLFTNNWILG